MGRRILVVDDEVSVRSLFTELFQNNGCEVLAVETAAQALEIIKEQTADVIFLDLKLFGTSGVDLCRNIRKLNAVSIIYAMTGWAALFDIEECRAAGFDDFFIKPIGIKTLSNIVEDAFEKLSRWENRYDM